MIVVFAGRVPVPPVTVTTCPTFRPMALAATVNVLDPAVSATPGDVCAATVPNSRRAVPVVVGLAESVTVVPLMPSTVVLPASTPVDPAAVVTVMPG